MSESAAHAYLVHQMVTFIASQLLTPMDSGLMLIDSVENAPQRKPPPVFGHIPDVFVLTSNEKKLIIGEAKTPGDLDNQHTRDQLCGFLRKCAEYDASVLVMAVQWDQSRLASSLLKACKRDNGLPDVQSLVIDRLSTSKAMWRPTREIR